MIDLYCERIGPGLLAEPLNAATNACFLLAAWFSWRAAGARRDVHVLALLLAAIGVGSAFFHTYATISAQRLDVVPILLFQLSYLWLYLRRCGGVGVVGTCLLLGAYGGALAATAPFAHALNGSLAYLPAASALVLLGIFHYRTRTTARTALLAASLLFLVSLTLRTADNALCPHWPIGTHWLWHCLNALVLFMLTRAYLQSDGRGLRNA